MWEAWGQCRWEVWGEEQVPHLLASPYSPAPSPSSQATRL